ncbi:MAG TPA: hypothetical protein VJ608_04575 [Albitalea sp.]|nr:hypothetical protein [Albitalea sp.]
MIILLPSVERARMGCAAVRWQGATTLRADAREEEQRSQRAAAQLSRARSAVTAMVTVDVSSNVSVHVNSQAGTSAQLSEAGS